MDSSDVPRGLAAGLSSDYYAFGSDIKSQCIIHLMAFFVLSAIAVGLIVIGLGDHYLWSLAPGRTLASLFLGAWASRMQTRESEAPAIS